MLFSSPLCHFHRLRSNYFPQSRLLKRLQSLFYLTCESRSLTHTKTIVKTIVVVVVVVVVVVFYIVSSLEMYHKSAIKATGARRRKR